PLDPALGSDLEPVADPDARALPRRARLHRRGTMQGPARTLRGRAPRPPRLHAHRRPGRAGELGRSRLAYGGGARLRAGAPRAGQGGLPAQLARRGARAGAGPSHLPARGVVLVSRYGSLLAFERRCIPARFVAPPLRSTRLRGGRRASRSGRLGALGANNTAVTKH